MNESRAIPVLVNLFKIDYKFVGIVFGICEDFGTKKGNYVVCNDLPRLVLEVCIVYTEM